MGKLKAVLIFDNGGGLTMQLGGVYGHWYQDMGQAVEDFLAYLGQGGVDDWGGNESDSLELVASEEQIRSGGYRVYSMAGIIELAESGRDISWANVQDFVGGLKDE